MTNKLLDRLHQFRPFYFNTSLVKVTFLDQNIKRVVYAKYEPLQLSGSIKDRLAYYVFKEGYESGSIKADTKLVEVSSGNTAIALTALGHLLGHKIKIICPEWITEERKSLLQLYGAELELTKGENAFLEAIAKAQEWGKSGYFYVDQFSSIANIHAHQYTTGPELFSQMAKHGLIPDYFIAGVGSGGTCAGLQMYIKEKGYHTKSILLEPKQSPSLTLNQTSSPMHLIQGIGDGFVPNIIDISAYQGIIQVDDYASTYIASLINKQGLSVGISSGANLLGAIELLRNDPNAIVTTVIPDCSKKYLSTQLTKPFTFKKRLPNIHVISIDVVESGKELQSRIDQ
jgi:cysteine synthase A